MSIHTGKCLFCDAIVWEGSLSLRGMCPSCEREFKRVTEQRLARQVLQIPLPLEEPES